MKAKVGKIVWIMLLLFVIMQNVCFADVVWQDPETGEWIKGASTLEAMKEARKEERIEKFYEWFLEKGDLWISLGIVITIGVVISMKVLNKTS